MKQFVQSQLIVWMNFVKNNNDTKIEFDVQGISIDNLDNISRKTLN